MHGDNDSPPHNQMLQLHDALRHRPPHSVQSTPGPCVTRVPGRGSPSSWCQTGAYCQTPSWMPWAPPPMAFPRSSPWTPPCRRVLRSSISVVVRPCRGPLRRLGGHVLVPRVCALSPTTLVFVVRARTNDRQALTSTGRPNHSDRLHVAPPILPLPILIHIWTC